MARLIVCSDGTWQSLRNETPTNVAKIAQLIRPRDGSGTAQVVFYDPGVGTGGGVDRLSGGVTNMGGRVEIRFPDAEGKHVDALRLELSGPLCDRNGS